MRIRYLSYGISKTGGYRHEKCLFDTTISHLSKNGNTLGELKRLNSLFGSVFGYVQLLLWSFFKSNGDINIVTSRLGLSAILRNLFNKKQVWIVMHNFDETDNKSKRMVKYYQILFNRLRHLKNKRFKVIVVAPYWVLYFKNTLKLPHVYHFPNFFDLDIYKPYKSNQKNAWVHLGQYSSKNDPDIIKLAALLSKQGYYCFFSTLNPEETLQGNGVYDILYFLNFSDYLDNVSRACCTLALSQINEGWNRMAHESILVGTPVIGYDKGGLGDLLKISNSVIVKDINEAYTCIVKSLWVLPDNSFNLQYHLNKRQPYIQEICAN